MPTLTICECIKGISGYPIPQRTLEEVALRRGITLSSTATKEILEGAPYNLCLADVYRWLSGAPTISQGGQSYSFDSEQRTWFKNQANSLYEEFGEQVGSVYGYKGSML